ncbi:putative bifunctional diguanylate cyclase/phosphodiesterase [Amaricoccus macauensis]|uniref:putative bifunctional diguanylate cyclase/phosphodiesterase n=1 Tax=Amaricoccus macauensis TaxID=57001 RepID=UPI003C7C55E2
MNLQARPVARSEAGIGEDAAALIDMLAASVVPLVHLDENQVVLFANDALVAFAGLGRIEPAGQPIAEAFPQISGPNETRLDATLIPRWVHLSTGGWIGLIDPPDTCSDTVARRDSLTGLGNRLALDSAFEALARSSEPGALICLDLDRFKRVNDTLGHPVGDKLLRKVAGRLRHAVRSDDSICRMGGDEFAILLHAPSVARAADDIAARIVDLLSRPFIIDGHQINIGASVGLALVLPDDPTISDAFRRADIALYQSKRKGRGQFQWFVKEMSDALELRRIIETELRAGILRQEFELHYQPQFDAFANGIIGFEALVRWNHPERGLLSPAAFLPICEESGLIVDLGTWVLDSACQAATEWPDHVTIAVNVSPIQFLAKGFVESVETALELSGLAPHRLELEVTETVMLGQETEVAEQMHRLRELGVILSLDDFGTGYSSLSYLHNYPFQKVKIDQSFVRASDGGTSGIGIVKAVADLGRTFGMKVLAEGVETAHQYRNVTETGCGLIQGFLIGRPLPQDQVSAFLAGKPFLDRIADGAEEPQKEQRQ